MSHKKHFWIPFVAFLVLAIVGTTVYAQPTATQIVNIFNGLNGNQGFLFDNQTTGVDSIQRLTTSSGSSPDLSAYASGIGGTNYFQTFCIQPANTNVASSGTATLNYIYDPTAGSTSNSSGTALTFGAAYLYYKFATGALVVDEFMANEFYVALNTLTGDLPSMNWSTNEFLKELRRSESDLTYWTRDYDPGVIYSEIGNFSVFVVNLSSAGLPAQNVLYLANSSGAAVEPPSPNGVPEPTALLLWILGGFGMAGTSWIHSRSKKKWAFA